MRLHQIMSTAVLVTALVVGGTGLSAAAAPSASASASAPKPDPTQELVDTVVDLLPPKRVDVPAGLAAGTRCYTARAEGKAKAKAGNTLFTFYTVGGWCHSGGTVVTSWFLDAGGETSTPGWRYEGVRGTGSGVAYNEGRSFSQHDFTLGMGGWDVQHPTPCLRVKGLAEARALVDTRCGVH